MVKFGVMLLLFLKPEMRTEFEPFSVIVVLPMETYFELLWSRFSANDEGIWNFSTLLTIPCKNVSYACFAPAWISTFPVVAARLTKPIRWNRPLAKVQVQNSTWLSSCFGCLSTKAWAIKKSLDHFIKPFKKQRPPSFLYFDDFARWPFLGSCFFSTLLGAVFKSSCCTLLQSRKYVFKWIKAFLFPFLPAYRPIWKLSTSMNLV